MALRDLKAKLGLDAEFDKRVAAEYPFASVAEAVIDLRVRHGLTQAALGRLASTPQSVIARLESGRHPAELALLNRIAAAVGESWTPTFSGPSAEMTPSTEGIPEGLHD